MRRNDEFEAPGAFRVHQPDLAGIDSEWLSATIGSIYDCVLQPERWAATIEAIARQFSFQSTVLGILQIRPGAHEMRVHFGIDEEWLAIDNTYMEDSVRLWGGAERIGSFPLDEPVLASEVTPEAEWKDNRYYRDVLQQRGMIDAAVVPLARQPWLMGYLAANRHRSAGPIRGWEIEGLRLLAPHLRRAVTISNFLDLKAVAGKSFVSLLDSLASAVVLVDADLEVVDANRAAAAMLDEGGLLRPLHGKLSLGGGLAEDALRSTVQLCARDEALLGQRGIAIPARHRDGSPALLHVLPLVHGELRGGLVQRAVAAIFVAPTEQSASTPVDAISLLYDFTPTESQIFAALAKGRTLAQAAMALGIAKSTARTHLLRIFGKTGCKRQAELVVLASRLSPTL